MVRFPAIGIMVFLLAGCADLGFLRIPEGPVGAAHRPLLEDVFITPQSTRSEPVRIYVKASDPDGDIDRFVVSLEQLGNHHYEQIVILPRRSRAVSGYIDFSGRVPPDSQPIGNLEVWVNVLAEDRAGNRSEVRRLYLVISDRYVEQVPAPQGRFEVTRRLGWLPDTLRTPESQVGNGKDE